jgi:transposase
VGKDTVARIWRARNLKPWKVDTFKLSNDPDFEAKLIDVVGLYLDPPERAVVLCFDEKSQCQALERSQPSLPIVPGRPGTMTHDYKRHGTTTLFAALDTATGRVLNHCFARHRHREFLAFLKMIDGQVPRDLEIHLVLDNYAAHKHPKIVEWLAKPRQRRWHLHFTPTSASWLNLVERSMKGSGAFPNTSSTGCNSASAVIPRSSRNPRTVARRSKRLRSDTVWLTPRGASTVSWGVLCELLSESSQELRNPLPGPVPTVGSCAGG